MKSIDWYLEQVFVSFEPALKDFLRKEALIKEFAAGEVMMRHGQYIKYTTLIAEGRVKLYRQGDDGEEAFLYYLEQGNACAVSMVCAVKQETSQLVAKAVEDTIVLMVPIELMNRLMSNYPSWFMYVIENYKARYDELLLLVDNVVFKGMDERLEFYLKNQVNRTGNKEIRQTHQEIANDLNTAREVISRLLKKLEQKGKVVLQRNYIEWVD
jgi:CRP/FNR family transcriptional regulator